MSKKYPVVTLCGSTRFKTDFERVQKELTLKGYIVISVGLFGHSGDEEVWEGMSENTLTETKQMLDDMHKRKIDMADETFVVNPGGYIGDSTWSEIRYAYMTDKKIKSLVEIPGAEIKERAEDVIARAEEQAEHSIDALRHEGVYADLEIHPSFVFKGETIYDPWVNEAANSAETDFSDHNDPKQAVEPFSYYGKQKVADFVERVIAMHNK